MKSFPFGIDDDRGRVASAVRSRSCIATARICTAVPIPVPVLDLPYAPWLFLNT